MQHYICNGSCHGVSQTLGSCQSSGCSMLGQPLQACSCSDGAHRNPSTSVNALYARPVHRSLHVLAFGFAFGVGTGLYMFFIGLVSALSGFGGSLVQSLQGWYVGFEPTFLGAFVGLLWGFIDGFIGGVIIAWLYNVFSRR